MKRDKLPPHSQKKEKQERHQPAIIAHLQKKEKKRGFETGGQGRGEEGGVAWRSGQGNFFIRMIPTSYSMVHIVLYSYSKVLYESVTRTAKLSFNFPQASKHYRFAHAKLSPPAREVRGVVRGGKGKELFKRAKSKIVGFRLGLEVVSEFKNPTLPNSPPPPSPFSPPYPSPLRGKGHCYILHTWCRPRG